MHGNIDPPDLGERMNILDRAILEATGGTEVEVTPPLPEIRPRSITPSRSQARRTIGFEGSPEAVQQPLHTQLRNLFTQNPECTVELAREVLGSHVDNETFDDMAYSIMHQVSNMMGGSEIRCGILVGGTLLMYAQQEEEWDILAGYISEEVASTIQKFLGKKCESILRQDGRWSVVAKGLTTDQAVPVLDGLLALEE